MTRKYLTLYSGEIFTRYLTFYGPILRYLVTIYSVYEVKCDQKVDYGTIKSSAVRISQLYQNLMAQNLLNSFIFLFQCAIQKFFG